MAERKSRKRSSEPEAVRKRLENSLPWSLSRWFSGLFGQSARSKKK